MYYVTAEYKSRDEKFSVKRSVSIIYILEFHDGYELEIAILLYWEQTIWDSHSHSR